MRLETSRGSTSICSILISSSPGKEKNFTSRYDILYGRRAKPRMIPAGQIRCGWKKSQNFIGEFNILVPDLILVSQISWKLKTCERLTSSFYHTPLTHPIQIRRLVVFTSVFTDKYTGIMPLSEWFIRSVKGLLHVSTWSLLGMLFWFSDKYLWIGAVWLLQNTYDCAIMFFFKHYSLVKLCGGVLFFSLRQLSNRPRWLTPKNTLNLTINQVCLSWHGVILAGLQMCRRWVGLAYFPLSKNQRLMATSQGSAAGSVCRVHLSSLCSLIRCVCINSLPSSDTLQGC